MKKPKKLRSKSAPATWSWHLRALTRLRTRLADEVADHLRESTRPVRTSSDDFSDVASEVSEHELLYAELAAEENQLAEIDAALARIRAGTYGYCTETGEKITAARLRALPWTRFCLAAARRRETEKPRSRRRPAS